MKTKSEGSPTEGHEEVAKEIKRVASESVSEEDLRQGVEYILKRRVIEKIKEIERVEIPYSSWKPPKARYEVTLVSGGRVDALYGHLIIEYEKPKTFESRSGFEKAIEQVKGYIRDHAEVEANFPRYFGVALDGYKIGFVRYREAIKGFESKGPFDINKNTVAKLIEAIVGLRRKALSAEELLKDFGPESPVAKESIKTLYTKLLGTSPRTQMLFGDWRRVFSQVCAYTPEKIKGLEEVYGFGKEEADPEKLLFALHTYYALIMKLLVAEVASLYVAPRLWSYLKALEDAYYRGHENLREELKELEEGGIFARLGIVNFMEADYFSWYLDEWDDEVAKCVMDVVDRLSNYDPSVADLEPERVKDLFKRLYQNLVPKKVRHDLGEYYTPDWLAELVLNEVGWTLETFEKKAQGQNNSLAPLELRLLDPACGSGTFLVLAIGRLRQYIEEHYVDKGTALRKIAKNIVGFDLNPLAVIASRTNYLIALGDILREKGAEPIEIPIYLADSIFAEKRQTLVGGTYTLRTAVGEFEIPTGIVEKDFLAKVLSLIEECVRGRYSPSEFKARLLEEVSLEEAEVLILVQLFEKLSKLEKEGKNRIWVRVLKNSFAPLFAGKFNYVVGNPPWINWSDLPSEYRNKTKLVWDKYGLLGKTKGTRLGAAERDMAMLFTYTSIDRYLESEGNFGFLITQSVFKSMAGEGFRRFVVPTGERPTKFKVVKVHDFVELLPFEGAQNRTAMIIAVKAKETTYPVPYILWKGPKVDQRMSLEEVLKETSRIELEALPLREKTGPWSTLSKKGHQIMRKVIGVSEYRAHLGIHLGLNSAYWVHILTALPDGSLLVKNVIEGAKRKVREVKAPIEKELIYPHLRGRDVNKWRAKPSLYVVLPINSQGKTLPLSNLRVNYPKTYDFFSNFFKELITRTTEPYKSQLKPWREETREIAEKIAPPFYMVFNVRPSLTPYKVVWKEQAGSLTAAVLEPIIDECLGEHVVIPDHKLMLVPCSNKDEAHFICAVLNSSLARLVAKSYTVETQISTHILEYIKVPKYDPNNSLHIRLSNLSKKAHQLAQQNQEDELTKVEEEIDKVVAQLYGLTDEELKEVKECLAILEGKENEEESEGVIEPQPNSY